MKKKLLILTVILLWGSFNYAQIGIGTVLPHPSAQLEVFSEGMDRGVLIPDIALKGIEDKSVIAGGAPKEGLVVYNITEDANLKLSKGFYYWGKVKADSNNVAVFGWNKLIGNEELQKYIIENKKDLVFESLKKDSNAKKTEGFRLAINGTEIGIFNETLTKFSIETSRYYVLVKDGSGQVAGNAPDEILVKLEVGDDENVFPDSKKVTGYVFSDVVINKDEFIYTDESGKTDVYELKNILDKAETLTSLRLETNYPIISEGVEKRVPALVYQDEIDVENPIFLDRLFDFSESLTDLKIDPLKKVLVYTDEKKNSNEVDVNAIVKSAWKKSGTVNEKGDFGDNIYTDGWVGIGYNQPSGAPNEKLRVNGSVTAVNSYYADYVFEAYFKGESKLKGDYKFNSLGTVENFIKNNNHLPGITPIYELNKTKNGYSFNLSELSIQLLEKTEELFLHSINQEKLIEKLQDENQVLRNRLDEIELLIREKLSN